MRLKNKNKILLIIKILATIAILGWIIKVISWEDLWSLLLSCNPYLIVIVVFLRFFSLPLSAYKWKKLLGIHDIHYTLTQLQKWYLAATFLGNFLPTSIGGDGYRLYKTINNRSGGSCAVLAIFVERLTGSFALLSIGYAAIVIIFIDNNDNFIFTMLMSFTIAGLFCSLFLFFC